MKFSICAVLLLLPFLSSSDVEGDQARISELPMGDYLDMTPVDEDQAVLGNDEDVGRWEALPLPISEADLAHDSDVVLREEDAGGNSLARQEIHEELLKEDEVDLEDIREYENLQVDLSKQVLEEDDFTNHNNNNNNQNERQENSVAGILEIYNVDDFDEKYDDQDQLK